MAVQSITGSSAQQSGAGDYFTRALDTLAGDVGMDLTTWPRDGIRVRGDEMSKLERSVHGLSALIELIHASSLNQDAVDNGHVDAMPALSDRMVDALHHAAGVLAWDSAKMLSAIRERVQEGGL